MARKRPGVYPRHRKSAEQFRNRQIIMKQKLLLAATLGCLVLGSGCAHVKPWERGALAYYTMRGDRDPLGIALDAHFFSREAAPAGAALAAAAAAAIEEFVDGSFYETIHKFVLAGLLAASALAVRAQSPFTVSPLVQFTNGEALLRVTFGVPAKHVLYADKLILELAGGCLSSGVSPARTRRP